jgi:hypothetical protein
MHRSGTSAITRAINLLGANLGDPANLYVAHDNPTGHWESTTLIACNDRILSAFGGSWAAPPFLPAGWEHSRAADELIPAMRQAFCADFDGVATPWLWKDPRTCLTLPLWRRAIGDTPVILVLRNPEGVARSLNRRDGFRYGYGLALWDHYTRSAMAAAAGLPTVVVRFEELLSRRLSAITELAEQLRTLGVDLKGEPGPAAESVRNIETEGLPIRISRRQQDLIEVLSDLPARSPSFTPPSLSTSRWRHARDLGPVSFPWGIRGRRRYPRGAG